MYEKEIQILEQEIHDKILDILEQQKQPIPLSDNNVPDWWKDMIQKIVLDTLEKDNK